MPLGLDVVEPPMLFELQKLGSRCATASRRCSQAREVKNIDELTLLNMAAAMVDGVYQDIAEALKPGVKESEIVALATGRLYGMGSDCVEAINADLRRALQPASAQLHRPPDPPGRPGVLRHHPVVHGLSHLLLPHLQRRPRDAVAADRVSQGARMDGSHAIDLLKPGVSTDRIARSLPTAKDIGFASEMDAFGLNFCHGLGLGLHERPLISRLTSLKEPIELKAGMVFAVETYCPASDGISAARIEEEVILTPSGPKIISLYPAEELPVANAYCRAAIGESELVSDRRKAEAGLDRHRPHGLRNGGAAGQRRRRRHGLESHACQGRAADRSTARRSRRRCLSLPRATSCSAWCRPGTTSRKSSPVRTACCPAPEAAAHGRRVLVDFARGLGRAARAVDESAASSCSRRPCPATRR